MRTRTDYEPLIPGTDINRVAYLRQLDTYHREEVYLDPLFRDAPLKELIADNVLNVAQIASVLRCERAEVKLAARGMGVDYTRLGITRGHFDPLAIQTMIRINELQMYRQEIPQTTLQYIARMVAPSLFKVFTGIDRATFYRNVHR